MHHLTLLLVHLFTAIFFAGTVFFEVLMLEGIRRHVPHEAMRAAETAVGKRARRSMPVVLLALYGAGAAMAWQYRAVLARAQGKNFSPFMLRRAKISKSIFHASCRDL